MPTRKTWRLGTTLVAGLLLFTVVSESGYPQSTNVPPPDALTIPPPDPKIALPMPTLPPSNHVVRAPVPHQQAPTVEQLLDQIAAIRAQKAELEKREQELVSTLRMKLAAQKERLTKLGIAESAAPALGEAMPAIPPVEPTAPKKQPRSY